MIWTTRSFSHLVLLCSLNGWQWSSAVSAQLALWHSVGLSLLGRYGKRMMSLWWIRKVIMWNKMLFTLSLIVRPRSEHWSITTRTVSGTHTRGTLGHFGLDSQPNGKHYVWVGSKCYSEREITKCKAYCFGLVEVGCGDERWTRINYPHTEATSMLIRFFFLLEWYFKTKTNLHPLEHISSISVKTL